MPDTQIALIRGINVGRAKRVAMADLRALVEELGYGDVRTLLNSGNVVFTTGRKASRNPAARIEKAMTASLGVSARVMVITATELAEIVAANPLLSVATDPSRLMITVLASAADLHRLEALAKEDWAPEVLALGARVAYSWCPDGIILSRLTIAMGRVLGDAATTRNWSTITKLHGLAGQQAPS
jgi:uncharacterized protein (DUF1697 family)